MSKRNGHIHFNILSDSSPDTVQLGVAVEERFLDIFHTHMRVRGRQLCVPKELDRDMLRWRQMRVRHNAGDFRNTPAELRSTQAIAQWAVNVNCELRNQKPKKILWEAIDAT